MSDSHNRLLAMLNQAASAPPPQSQAKASTPPFPGQGQSQATTQTQSQPISQVHLPSGGLREPSPLPPPPAISSMSLNDLFKNITSPPLPQQPGGISGMSASAQPQQQSQSQSQPQQPNGGGGSIHQNKLLGMLGGTGANGTGGVDRSKVTSPVSGVPSPLGSSQQVNLLSLFKSYVASRSGHCNPPEFLVDLPLSPPPPQEHTTAHLSSSYQPQTGITSPQSQIHDPIVAAASHQPFPKASTPSNPSSRPSSVPAQTPAPVQPQEPRSGMPSKSPFDFVSPFDAFARPPPKAVTPIGSEAASAKAQQQQSAASETRSKQQLNNQDFSIPAAHINGTVIHPGDAAASTKPASGYSPSISQKSQHGSAQPSPNVGRASPAVPSPRPNSRSATKTHGRG
jgi:hypothetical protein